MEGVKDIAQMRQITLETMAAGALGFASPRLRTHPTFRGEPTPTLQAEIDELLGIASMPKLQEAGW